MSLATKIAIVIDIDLEDIVPGYLANRQKDIDDIAQALAKGDIDTIRILGHRMKGSGAGYGFDEITEIGRRIEIAAKEGDSTAIAADRENLMRYLQSIEIIFK